MLKKILAATAATGLVVTPVVAQSLPTTAPVEGEELGGEGGATPVAIALIAGIAAIAAFAFFDDDDDDDAVSP